MLDHILSALALAQNAWAAFSPLAALVGLSGIALVAGAVLSLAVLPERLKLPLIALGAGLVALSAVWQAGQAKGAHDAFTLDMQRAIAAEAARAAAAERIRDAIAAQATADLAAEQTANTKLKDLLDAAKKRADARRVCLPRDLSRSLRAL